jgi:hypothetical protein
MGLYERNTRSFIVKVWVEPNGESKMKLLWRGHVTHVFTGQRQYFEDLAVMVDFIRLSLQEIGINDEWANPCAASSDPDSHISGAT